MLKKVFNISLIVLGISIVLGTKNLFATATAGSAPPATSTGLPQFDISSFPQQILWLVIIFVLLYIALSIFVIPQIRSIKHKRSHYIDENIFHYNHNNEEFEKISKNAQEKLAAAYRDAEAFLANLSHELLATEEKRLAEIKAQNEQLKNKTYDTILENSQSFNKGFKESLGNTVNIILDRIGVSVEDNILEAFVEKHIQATDKDFMKDKNG